MVLEALRRQAMIKKATERPKEVEYVEFKGQENFKEVSDFLGNRIIHELKISRFGVETINISGRGTFEVGTIFYRYLDPEIDDYKYDVMRSDKFFIIYEEERHD